MLIKHITKEIPGLVITAARYGMAERMARQVRNDTPIPPMLAFIAADILDGEILRAFNADTPARRIADGVVDHASAARIAYEIGKKYPASRAYIGILAARAAVVGALNLAHLASTGEVTKGRWNQKSTNLAMAAFALTATSGNKRATHITGLIASGIAITTVGAHFKSLGKKHAKGIREL